MEARVLETVLKTGKEAGFSTVEAFAEKIWRWESEGSDRPLSLMKSRATGCWPGLSGIRGDPLGFSLSNPDARLIKQYFAAWVRLRARTAKKTLPSCCPERCEKSNWIFMIPGIETWNEAQVAELLEKIRESLVTFPGLKLKKFHFSRMLKKIYLANSLGFLAKYKKTHFQIQVAFMLRDHVLELSESHIYFSHFDPERLVARAANLLGALTAEPGPGPQRNFLSCRRKPRSRC